MQNVNHSAPLPIRALYQFSQENPGRDPLRNIPLPVFPPKTKHVTPQAWDAILIENHPLNVKRIEGADPKNDLTPTTQNLRFFIEKTLSSVVSEKLKSLMPEIQEKKDSLLETLHEKTSSLLQTLSKAKNNPARDLFLNTPLVESNYRLIEEYLLRNNIKIRRSELTLDKVREILKTHPDPVITAKLDELAKTIHFEGLLEHLKKGIEYNEDLIIAEIIEKIKETNPTVKIDKTAITTLFDWINKPSNRGSIDDFLRERNVNLSDEVKIIVIHRFFDSLVKEKIKTLQSDIDESLSSDNLTTWIQTEVSKATNHLTYKIFDKLENLSNEEYSKLFNQALEIFNLQLKAEAEAKATVQKVRHFYSKALKAIQSNVAPKNASEREAKDKYLKFLSRFRKPGTENIPNDQLKDEHFNQELLNEYCDSIHFQAMTSALKSFGAPDAIEQLTKKLMQLVAPPNKGIIGVLQETITLPPKLQNLYQSFSFLKDEIYSQDIAFMREGGTLLRILLDSVSSIFLEDLLHQQVKTLVENICKPVNIIHFSNTTLLPALNSALIGNLTKQAIIHNLPKIVSWLNHPDSNLNSLSENIYELVKQESELPDFQNYVDQNQFRNIFRPYYHKLQSAKEKSLSEGTFQFDLFKETINLSFSPPANVQNNPMLGQILVNLTKLTDLPPFLKWLLKNSTVNQLLSHQLSYALHDYSSQFYSILNSVVESFKAKDELADITARMEKYEAQKEKVINLENQIAQAHQEGEDKQENLRVLLAFETGVLDQLHEQYQADKQRLLEISPLYEGSPEQYKPLSHSERSAIEERIRRNTATEEEIERLNKYKEFEVSKTARIAQSTLGYIVGKKIPFGRWAINKIFGEGAQVAINALRQVGLFFKNKARNRAMAIEVGNIAFKALDATSPIYAPSAITKEEWKGISHQKTMNKVERVVLGIFTLGLSELIMWIMSLNASPLKFGKQDNEIYHYIENMIQQREALRNPPKRIGNDPKVLRREVVSYHKEIAAVSVHTETKPINPSIIKAQRVLKDFLKHKTGQVYESYINHYFTVIQDSLKLFNKYIPGLNDFIKMVNDLIDGDIASQIDPEQPPSEILHQGPLKTIIEQSSILIGNEIFNRIVSILTNIQDSKWQKSMNELPNLLNDHLNNISQTNHSDSTARTYDLSKRLIHLIFPGTKDNPKSSYEIILFNKIFGQTELQDAFSKFFKEIDKLIASFKQDSFEFTKTQAEYIKDLVKLVVVHSVQKNIEKSLFKKLQLLVDLISKKETWDALFENKVYPAAIELVIIQKCTSEYSEEFNKYFDQWLSDPENFYTNAAEFFYKRLANNADQPYLKSLFFGKSQEKPLEQSIELEEIVEKESSFNHELTKEIVLSLLKKRISETEDLRKNLAANFNVDSDDYKLIFKAMTNFILTGCYKDTKNNSNEKAIEFLNSVLESTYKPLYESILIVKNSPQKEAEIQSLVDAQFGIQEENKTKQINQHTVRPYANLIKTILNSIQEKSKSKMLRFANLGLNLADWIGKLDPVVKPIAALLDPLNQSPEWLINLLSERLNFFLEEENKAADQKVDEDEASISNNTNVSNNNSSSPNTNRKEEKEEKELSNQSKFSQILFDRLASDPSSKVKYGAKAILSNPHKTEDFIKITKDLLFSDEEKLRNLILTFFESLVTSFELNPDKEEMFATHSIAIKDFQPAEASANNNNNNLVDEIE